MTKDDFEHLYDATVVVPLASEGWLHKGRRLYKLAKDHLLVVERAAGRASRAGQIGLEIRHRHRFLRDLAKRSVPKLFPGDFYDYPFRAHPSEFQRGRFAPRYRKGYLRAEFEYIGFEGRDAAAVEAGLRTLAASLVGPVSAWADSLTPALAIDLIINASPDAAVEVQWIEDYRSHLADS